MQIVTAIALPVFDSDDTSTLTSEQEVQVELSDAVSERTEVIACIW